MFFFTVNLADRRSRLLTTQIDLLRQAFRDVRQRHPFRIEAVVVLPDHLHAVWTLPEDDADFSLRWRLIKPAFSRALPPRRTYFSEPYRQGGARYLATAILGAHIAGRSGLCPACRLHSFQSCQAWACKTSEGLAVFVLPPHDQAGHLSTRLGGRCGRSGTDGFWRTMMRFAALNPSYGLMSESQLLARRSLGLLHGHLWVTGNCTCCHAGHCFVCRASGLRPPPRNVERRYGILHRHRDRTAPTRGPRRAGGSFPEKLRRIA